MTVGIEKWGNGGFSVRDRNILHAFLADPRNPFVVSFGRTGTHWFLTLLQAYFQRPGLVGVFLPEICPDWHDYDKYLYYHTHDHRMLIQGRENVIYLYRNPVDTVYSALVHKGLDLTEANACKWATIYSAFSAKWFGIRCAKKTLVYYDRLRERPLQEWQKVSEHFDIDMREKHFLSCLRYFTKERVRALARPEMSGRVIPLSMEYEEARGAFGEQWGEKIWAVWNKQQPEQEVFRWDSL